MGFLDALKMVGQTALPLLSTAATGGAAGPLIAIAASALGTDNDETAVMKALATDPDAILKLKQAEMDNKVQLQQIVLSQAQLDVDMRKAELAASTARHAAEITAQAKEQAEVNATMRAEYTTGDKFKSGWRPMFGYVLTGTYGYAVGTVATLMWQHPTDAVSLFDPLVTLLIVGCAVMGVNITMRSADKSNGGGLKGGLASMLFGSKK